MPIDLEALATLIEETPSAVSEKPKGASPPPQPPAPTGREIRARWFRTSPRPLPPEVLKRVGAIPEVHGLEGCWNIVGNRLSSRELAALLAALGEVSV
jgi:acetyl esterase/lipase